MLKAILFDLDHTLYDRYTTMEKTLPLCYERLKDDVCDGISYEYFEKMMIQADKDFNYAGWQDRVRWLTDMGVFKEGLDARRLRLVTYETMTSYVAEFDFVKPMLTRLREKGYKLGLVTNGEPYIQWAKIDFLGLKDYFDTVFVGGEHPRQKPHPEAFIEPASELGAEAWECIYVGDSPKNDIAGAIAAKMPTVWVATCGPWRYPEYPRADFEIEDVSHLEEILPEIAEFMLEKEKEMKK